MKKNMYIYKYICVCVYHFVVQQKLTQHLKINYTSIKMKD